MSESSPTNDTELRQNPFRSSQPIRQAQFRPLDSDIPPATQVPAPTSEAAIPPVDVPPTPPTVEQTLHDNLGSSSKSPLTIHDMTTDGEVLDGDVLFSETIPLGEFEQPFEDSGTEIYTTNAWFRRGYWYGQADVVLLLRTGAETVIITGDNSQELTPVNTGGGGGASNMMATTDVDPTYVPGTRIAVGRFLGQDAKNRDHMVELSFLGLFDYSERADIVAVGVIDPTQFPLPGLMSVLGPGNDYIATDISGLTGTVIGPPVTGFSFARRHDVLYTSDLNNVEFNYRIATRPGYDRLSLQPNGSWIRNASASRIISYLAGLRAMTINELFRLQATFVNNLGAGTYQVQTSNDMFGLQTGIEIHENYGNWSCGIRFKGGALFNFADRRSKRHTIDLFTGDEDIRDEHVPDENLVAVVEGGLVATYNLRPNVIARVAYDAMYINGIATAQQNLGLEDNFPRFEVTGDAIFHGFSAGIETMW